VTYRRKDAFYRRAQAAGYRARSAFKLAELDRRFGLLRRGDFVVDLGAWPGGWLQVILERIGPDGRVVGVDLADIPPLAAANVALLEADVREPATGSRILDLLGRPADAVLSDLAPKLTGVQATDEARCEVLVRAAIDLLPALLRPGGRLLTKLFMDPRHDALLEELGERFTEVKITRPAATRRGSAELYAAGLGYRGATS
jgi:23S rRNA (uridine2552-2'-O)-methyltransferase